MKSLQIQKIIKQRISGESYGKLFINDFIHAMSRPFNDIRSEIESIFTAAERTEMEKQGLKTYDDRQAFSRYAILADYLLNSIIRFSAYIYDAEIAMLKTFIILKDERLAEIIKLNSIVCMLKSDSRRSECIMQNIEESLRTKAPNENELLLKQLTIIIKSLKRCLAIQRTFEIIAERISIPEITGLLSKVPLEWVERINEDIQSLSMFPDNEIYNLLLENSYLHIDTDSLFPEEEKVHRLKQAISDLDCFSNTKIDDILM